ncbi:hypothetical protein Tco_1152603 [Tanacetum coccineum]
MVYARNCWNEFCDGDTQLRVMFPRIYALEINKDCTVADKLQFSITSSLRRSVRGGVNLLNKLIFKHIKKGHCKNPRQLLLNCRWLRISSGSYSAGVKLTMDSLGSYPDCA